MSINDIRIVQEGLKYRAGKGKPITQEEIIEINSIIEKVGFKIPDLVDPDFINGLPRERPIRSGEKTVKSPAIAKEKLDALKEQFLQISVQQPQERGYAFEKFLHDFFDIYGFNPRPSFRITGEQIDGSIEFHQEIYLIEAKWQKMPIRQDDLLILQGRVGGHSGFGRGFFITCGNFSTEGVAAFQRLGRSSIVGIDGQDLYLILHQYLPLDEILRNKVRWLVETGDFHYPVVKFGANIINNIEMK